MKQDWAPQLPLVLDTKCWRDRLDENRHRQSPCQPPRAECKTSPGAQAALDAQGHNHWKHVARPLDRFLLGLITCHPGHLSSESWISALCPAPRTKRLAEDPTERAPVPEQGLGAGRILVLAPAAAKGLEAPHAGAWRQVAGSEHP